MTAAIIQTDGKAIVLDLSTGATLCGQRIAGLSVDELGALINRSMSEAGTAFAFGRWAEPRELYSNDNFATDGSGETRTIHMGVDLFCAAGTPVHAPMDGVVEYAANNKGELDYGPMLIVRHADQNDVRTLYGHLSLDTLDLVCQGQAVTAGEVIAAVGEPPGNGNWPPHLHFQLINDLVGLGTDFPGVALKSEQQYWLGLSPSPASYFPECDARALEYRL